MSCYHPNLMIFTGLGECCVKDKNDEYKFVKRDWMMIKNTPENRKRYEKVAVEVPCGKCVGCRLDYSRMWANRCSLEAKQYKYNYFLTITYNDENVPIGRKGNYTLEPDDLTKFMKRLRVQFNREYERFCKSNNVPYEYINIRFFGCGEYGENTFRPHYHVILFNCPLFDLSPEFPAIVDGKEKKVRKYSSANTPLYYSSFLEKVWGKGNIQVGDFSWNSCSYVARYVMKKAIGSNSSIYDKLGVFPEFLRMSRNPGIGKDYYLENRDKIYDTHEIFISNGDKVIKSAPPRYFDRLEHDFQEENGEVSLDLFKRSNIMLNRSINHTIESATSIGLDQARLVKEDNHLDRVRILARKI